MLEPHMEGKMMKGTCEVCGGRMSRIMKRECVCRMTEDSRPELPVILPPRKKNDGKIGYGLVHIMRK